MSPLDGCELVIGEMFKYNMRYSSKISDIAGVVDDYIRINDVKSRFDEIRKWTKLCETADILNLYKVTKSKEITFKQIDELITLPSPTEKAERVDELIKLVVEDITSSKILRSIIGNESLLASIKQCIHLQKMIEGKERVFDVVKIYAGIVFSQKKYELPKALKEEPEIYAALELVILDKMKEEFKAIAEEVQNRVGDEKVTIMISAHQKFMASLDNESNEIQDYSLFLKLID